MSQDGPRVHLPVYDDGTDRAVEHRDVHRRPRTREECAGGPRPCPWVSCTEHLAWMAVSRGPAEVQEAELDLAVRDLSAERPSCVIDVVDAHPEGLTLDEVGQLFGVTRERIRQIESKALARLPRRTEREGLSIDDAEGTCEADELPTPKTTGHTRARPVEDRVRVAQPAPEGVQLLTAVTRAEDTGWCRWYGCKLRASGCVGRQNARRGNDPVDSFCADECADGPVVAANIGASVTVRRSQRATWGEDASPGERFRARLAAGLCAVPGCSSLRGVEDFGRQIDPLLLALCSDHRVELHGTAAGSTERRGRVEAFGVDLDALDAWLDLRASAPRCQVPRCQRPAEPGHDRCETHLQRALAPILTPKTPSPVSVVSSAAPAASSPSCTREGCTRVATRGGLCGRHAGAEKRAVQTPQPTAPCAVSGCERLQKPARGIEAPLDTYCAVHRNRERNQLFKQRRAGLEPPQGASVPEVPAPLEPPAALPSLNPVAPEPSPPAQESTVHESPSKPIPPTSETSEEAPRRERCAAKGCRARAGEARSNTGEDLAPLCPAHRKLARDRARSRGVPRADIIAELCGRPAATAPSPPSAAPSQCRAKGCDRDAAGVRADTRQCFEGLCPNHRAAVRRLAQHPGLGEGGAAALVVEHGDAAREHLAQREPSPPALPPALVPPPTPVPPPAPVPAPSPTPAPAPAAPPAAVAAPTTSISRKIKLEFTLPVGSDADRALACAERVGGVAQLEQLVTSLRDLEGLRQRVEALGGFEAVEALATALRALRGTEGR